jgi:hypothetical protein
VNHEPKKLALLISLIGAGVSPYAMARTELRDPGEAQAALDAALAETSTALLERSDPSTEWMWRPEPALTEVTSTPKFRIVYLPFSDDRAPGEMVAADSVQARESTLVEEVRTPEALPAVVSASIEPDAPASRKKRTHKPRVHKPAVAEFVVDARSEAMVEPRLPAADRVLEALATTLEPQPLSVEVESLPVLRVEAVLSALTNEVRVFDRELAVPRIGRVDVIVESQSSKVLRSLDALLTGERDEVGAIRTEPAQDSVVSQTDKVLAMLDNVTGPREVVETGPAKRARKLAALAAKKAAEQAIEIKASVARDGVDLMLPLEPGPATLDIDLDDPSIGKIARVPLSMAAAPAAPRKSPFGDHQVVAVSEQSLDRVRGGFLVDGLNISFGIERAVYINGSLVTSTSFNVSDLGRITGGRAPAFDANTIALIRNGAGNTVTTGSIPSGSVGTIVQNTLDGQKIQNVTVINATTNSLGVLRGLNLQSSLRSAVIDSLRR